MFERHWYREFAERHQDALCPGGAYVSTRAAARVLGISKSEAATFMRWFKDATEVVSEDEESDSMTNSKNDYAQSDLMKLRDALMEKVGASKVEVAPVGRMIVSLSDIHIPHDDTALVQKIIEWIKTQTLDTLVLNGDILDCAKISKYLGHGEMSLSDEILRGNVFLDQILAAARAMNPQAKVVWIDGNHEDRLNKYLMANADALIDLMVDGEPLVSLQHLLRLKERRVTYKPYNQHLELPGGLFIEHGHRVSKHAAYTVSNAMRDLGGSLIMGHVHRIGSVSRTDRTGTYRGYEQGCLCLPPSYMPAASANWQLGFGIIRYTDATTWWYEQVYCQDGSFMINGRLV